MQLFLAYLLQNIYAITYLNVIILFVIIYTYYRKEVKKWNSKVWVSWH